MYNLSYNDLTALNLLLCCYYVFYCYVITTCYYLLVGYYNMADQTHPPQSEFGLTILNFYRNN